MIGETPRDRRIVTRSEALLLQTYGHKAPTPKDAIPRQPVDDTSVNILQTFHPSVLSDVYPAETYGDGNYLYRAVSRALTGNETLYLLLRVLTLLEILAYPIYYDSDHKRFVDLLKDNRIVVATYVQLAKDAARLGVYADMMHMYALSAVLKLPIRSYYPPQFNAEFVSEPYSRKVCGRGVNLSDVPVCTVMWTSASNRQGNSFVPNHFVPLLKRNNETTPDTITIDDDEVAPNQDNTFCAEPNQDSIFCAEPNQHSIFCSDDVDSNTKDTESASADDNSLSCPFIKFK